MTGSGDVADSRHDQIAFRRPGRTSKKCRDEGLRPFSSRDYFLLTGPVGVHDQERAFALTGKASAKESQSFAVRRKGNRGIKPLDYFCRRAAENRHPVQRAPIEVSFDYIIEFVSVWRDRDSNYTNVLPRDNLLV